MTSVDGDDVRLTADLLRDAAASDPDRDAYVHGDKRVTYAWLDRAADGFATTLLEAGVDKGDVVCLMLPSSIKFAACYLGALRVGAITSAINLRLGPVEQASIIGRTDPKLTVLGDGAHVPSGVDPGRLLAVGDLGAAFAAGEPPPARLPRIEPTDPTCIVWTSGTTGIPKGAVYDHAAQAFISLHNGDLTAPHDRRLWVLPFPHVGYMTRVWDELANRTTLLICTDPWSATEALRLVREEGVTMATGVPTQWALVLEHPDLARTDFSTVRVAGTGGAPAAPELIRRMRETLGCPIVSRYTSTEAGITSGTRIGEPDEVVATTLGRPAPGVDLRIVDVTTGAPVAAREVGEVTCRSRGTMRGYWRDPELTATVIDGEGFVHTGDLGYIGDDGNLRLVGRTKEMYIRGGYNVYPAEVEAILADNPAVSRAAVVGVPAPVLGEVGVAFVVPATGASPRDLDRETLRSWCRDRLADYKAPDRVVVLDELPVTSMLKIDKQALVKLASEEHVE